MTSTSVRIAIDVRIAGREISGHASAGGGKPHSFLGWLGLIGALDTLLHPHLGPEPREAER